MIVVAKINLTIREIKPFTNKIANRQEKKTKKCQKIRHLTAPIRSSVHSCMREKTGKKSGLSRHHVPIRMNGRTNEL